MKTQYREIPDGDSRYPCRVRCACDVVESGHGHFAL